MLPLKITRCNQFFNEISPQRRSLKNKYWLLIHYQHAGYVNASELYDNKVDKLLNIFLFN